MWASIIEGVIAFFKAIPVIGGLIEKYFPPKSTEQKVEEANKEVDDEIKKIEETGRP